VLGEFTANVAGEPLVPHSLLNGLRRELVESLDAQSRAKPSQPTDAAPCLPRLRQQIEAARVCEASSTLPPPRLLTLCRTHAQARAAAGAGSSGVYLEYQDIKQYRATLAWLRAEHSGLPVFLATPRIEKPGEQPLFRHLCRLEPDGLLVRNAGGVLHCTENGVDFVADFSINASNELAVDWWMAKGARRVTASYDLSFDQVDELARSVPPSWLEIVVHQHMPMFHMEHCVFCAFLSPGHDKTDCGRPCDRHDVRLRDRVGMEHRLTADVGCRNTLYNAVPQSAAEYLPRLIECGVREFRLEFLDDSPRDVVRVLDLYHSALRSDGDPRDLWKQLRATNRYGVTRGQLAVVE
jgi:putative protease